jgi:alcohol dehydrogenase (cytochrome c)
LPPAPRPDVTITTKDLMAGLSNQARWLTYSGDYLGQRHSPLNQITPANVGQLSAQWNFQTAVTTGFRTQFEATPIVIDGVIYQTGPLNYAWAIDAKTGRQIWHYRKVLPPPDTMKVCCGW